MQSAQEKLSRLPALHSFSFQLGNRWSYALVAKKEQEMSLRRPKFPIRYCIVLLLLAQLLRLTKTNRAEIEFRPPNTLKASS